MPFETKNATLDIGEKTFFLYGEPKIGKTTFAASFPGAVFLCTERGHDNLTTTRWIDADGNYVITDWPKMMQAVAEAVQSPDTKLIVIDVVDHAYTMVDKYICDCNGEVYRGDGKLGYGKGSSIIENEFRNKMKSLIALASGKGVMFISHSKTIDNGNGVLKTIPTLAEKAMALLTGEVDIILYATTEKLSINGQPTERRVLRTKPSTLYLAGDRTPLGLPATIPLDYAEFARLCAEGAARVGTANAGISPATTGSKSGK